MISDDLLVNLRTVGFTLSAKGGKLLVSPASKLTPELTEAIREHKPALLALLAAERPLTPLERFLTTCSPTHAVELIVERGGEYVAVSAQEYIEAIGEHS